DVEGLGVAGLGDPDRDQVRAGREGAGIERGRVARVAGRAVRVLREKGDDVRPRDVDLGAAAEAAVHEELDLVHPGKVQDVSGDRDGAGDDLAGRGGFESADRIRGSGGRVQGCGEDDKGTE